MEPTDFTAAPKVTLESFVQPLNAPAGIAVTFAPIFTDFSFLVPAKALDEMEVTL